MKAESTTQAKRGLKERLHSFEELLPELSHRELQHMLAVLQRHDNPAAREKLELVVKEIDIRRYVCQQPAMAAP